VIADLLPATAAAPARRLWLPFLLPSFNDLEAARGVTRQVRPGAMMNGYHALKRRHQQTCVAFFNRCRPLVPPPEGSRVFIAYRWVEPDRKRDPHGVAHGGAKIIDDALARGRGGPRGWPGAGIIHCDGWHCVAGSVNTFAVDAKNPGIEVLLYEVAP
jgi:hypothetical protein